MAVRDTQIDAANRFQITLERSKAGQSRLIAENIRELASDISTVILGIDDISLLSNAEFELLSNEIGVLFSSFSTNFDGRLSEFNDVVIDNSVELEVGMLESLGVEGVEGDVAAAQTRFQETRMTDGGSGVILASALLSALYSNELNRVINTIRAARTNGQTPQELAQSIRGTQQNRFRDGILSTTQRSYDATMRTVVQHASTSARISVMENNGVDKYEWVSTLDSRTTTKCKGLDGQMFEINNGPLPPIHYGCRSVIVANVDGVRDTVDADRTARGASGRTSRVDADLTYYEWLRRQPATFQDDAIGPVRGKLFREGGLSAEEFRRLSLNRNFEPLTLDEMRSRRPRAFELAGL